ncbi:hypothetical protein [Novosphingobium sp. ZW T3_23]|uniref:hypothetical protein n=1 Tax=Novosphingobium sp. ZW T3_23 TaxID=3378084 RepID=UPI003852B36B
MDLNQLLSNHQIALIRYAVGNGDAEERGSQYDLVKDYESRIARLRHAMGVPAYPKGNGLLVSRQA